MDFVIWNCYYFTHGFCYLELLLYYTWILLFGTVPISHMVFVIWNCYYITHGFCKKLRKPSSKGITFLEKCYDRYSEYNKLSNFK